MTNNIETVKNDFEADNTIKKIRDEVWEYAVSAFTENHKKAIQNPQVADEMHERNQVIVEQVMRRGCVPYHICETLKAVHQEMVRRATPPQKIAHQIIEMQMVVGTQTVPQNA